MCAAGACGQHASTSRTRVLWDSASATVEASTNLKPCFCSNLLLCRAMVFGWWSMVRSIVNNERIALWHVQLWQAVRNGTMRPFASTPVVHLNVRFIFRRARDMVASEVPAGTTPRSLRSLAVKDRILDLFCCQPHKAGTIKDLATTVAAHRPRCHATGLHQVLSPGWIVFRSR